MKPLKTLELFDLTHTMAADFLSAFSFPWEALSGIQNLILELGATLGEEYTEVSPQV